MVCFRQLLKALRFGLVPTCWPVSCFMLSLAGVAGWVSQGKLTKQTSVFMSNVDLSSDCALFFFGECDNNGEILHGSPLLSFHRKGFKL